MKKISMRLPDQKKDFEKTEKKLAEKIGPLNKQEDKRLPNFNEDQLQDRELKRMDDQA